jgi:hypothetical protein
MTITIGSTIYEVYGSRVLADAYFQAASHGAPWTAADGGVRNNAMVTAMRVFERTGWQGDPTEPTDKTQPQPANTQPLVWPRAGLQDREGLALDPATIPDDILWGSYEYALELITTPSVQTDPLTGSNIKTQKSSQRVEGAITVSEEVGFFKPTLGKLPPFPTITQDYIGLWLASSVVGSQIFVSGTDVESAFTDEKLDWGYTDRGIP